MKCTSCKQGRLIPSFIDGLFRSHTCEHCQGNWLLIEDYVAWKERNPEFVFDESANFSLDDSKNALLCPMTGTIMRKFRLSVNNEHRIDYSASVGGVCLDKGEWQLLKAEGLAGSLNAVLTVHWQRNLRITNSKENFAEIYQDKFGSAAYEQVKTMRSWLAQQPNKADLRAYLLAEDPYSAEK